MNVFDEMDSFFETIDDKKPAPAAAPAPAQLPSQSNLPKADFDELFGIIPVSGSGATSAADSGATSTINEQSNMMPVTDPLGITASTQIVPPPVPSDMGVPVATAAVLASTPAPPQSVETVAAATGSSVLYSAAAPVTTQLSVASAVTSPAIASSPAAALVSTEAVEDDVVPVSGSVPPSHTAAVQLNNNLAGAPDLAKPAIESIPLPSDSPTDQTTTTSTTIIDATGLQPTTTVTPSSSTVESTAQMQKQIDQLTESLCSLRSQSVTDTKTLNGLIVQQQLVLQQQQQQIAIHEMHIQKQNQVLATQAGENAQLQAELRSLQLEIKQRFNGLDGSLRELMGTVQPSRQGGAPSVVAAPVPMHAGSLTGIGTGGGSLDSQLESGEIGGDIAGLRSALKKNKSATSTPSPLPLDQGAIAALVTDPNMSQDDKDRLIAEQLQRMYDQEDAQTTNQQVQQQLQQQQQHQQHQLSRPHQEPRAPAVSGSAKKPALGGWMKNLFGMPASANSTTGGT